MTSPCRSCSLQHADKNNAACMQCSRRVAYVSRLAGEFAVAPTRTSPEAAPPRVALLSRQAQFLAVAPDTCYE